MTALIAIIGAVFYVFFYFVYGKRLEKEVVRADPNRPTPAVKLRDNVDYVPAKPWVLYGHHFASIAGAGPITGPAIAMAWGWLPGLLWVWLGNLFIGSVHDYLALMASVRYDGKSIQWVSGKLMTARTKYSFELFIYFALLLVISAFMGVFTGLAVANPSIATASVLFIFIALIEGVLLYRTKLPFSVASIIGIIMLVICLYIGYAFPFIKIASPKTWYVILAVYCVLAASLPVWILLQPRDYLNAYILWAGLILGLVAAIFAFKGFNWPSFTIFNAITVGGKPSPFWPTVPLVIACGALSGFHSIVASGTSSKQLDNELSGLFVGYGSMFTEGFLSTLVITSIAAFGMSVFQGVSGKLTELGIDLNLLMTDKAYLGNKFLAAANTVGGALGVMTRSFGKMTTAVGLSESVGNTFAGLWVSAFVLTTLDTSVRLARYAWGEIWEPVKNVSEGFYKFISDKWVGSIIAAGLGLLLIWGGSYTVLWPGFAGSNQLLASIAMITAAIWVKRVQKAKPAWQMAVLIPALFLWITVTIGLIWYLIVVVPSIKVAFNKYMLGGFTVVMLALNVILVTDFLAGWRKGPLPEAETK